MNRPISMPVSIYALGGLGEVGKNMYCLETDNSIVILDAGVRFPGADLPGIDYIVPDYTHLKNNRNKIKALLITHGHEDHIGGIPFLLQNVNIPEIYAPKLALALIKNRLEEYRLSERTKLYEYDSNTKLHIDCFNFSFFRVTHSIPDSYGIVADTPEGRIVSTGDFKVDLTPIGPDMELSRMAKLGDEGVDLLLSDSTNAENEGYTPSEKNVLDSIYEIFNNATGRLIISTFSSNISRIQQICEVAYEKKRKICIIGRSMAKAVEISRSFGYITVPDTTIIQPEDIKTYKNNELLILCTGSQGEPMAALSRIANGEHKDVHIVPGDTVVFSSSAIPGNGIMIDRVVNLLSRSGAEVVTNSILSDIHSSGHPSKMELRLVFKLFRPKYFMPMHGEFRMLKLHAELASTVGVKKENCFVLDNGDVITLAQHKITRGYEVEHGVAYIDGRDINGLSDAVMRDRKILTSDGMIAITLTIDSKKNVLLSEPTILNRGLINQGSKSMQRELSDLVTTAVNEKLASKTNYADIKLTIKNTVGQYIYSKTRLHPMVIPVLLTKN